MVNGEFYCPQKYTSGVKEKSTVSDEGNGAFVASEAPFKMPRESSPSTWCPVDGTEIRKGGRAFKRFRFFIRSEALASADYDQPHIVLRGQRLRKLYKKLHRAQDPKEITRKYFRHFHPRKFDHLDEMDRFFKKPANDSLDMK